MKKQQFSLNRAVSTKQFPISKLLSWVLSLVLFVASSVSAQVVTTSKSTLTLQPFEGLTTENSLRQAGRIAEIGVGELLVDVAALGKEEQTLINEMAAYEKTKKDEQAKWDIVMADFNVIEKKYSKRLAHYEKRHNTDPLDGEFVTLNEEHTVLEAKRKECNKYKQDVDAELKAINDPLRAKIDTLKAKMGLAYRQLKLCAGYGAKIKKKLEVEFNIKEVRSPVLNGAMEQLKALSGRGWDTP